MTHIRWTTSTERNGEITRATSIHQIYSRFGILTWGIELIIINVCKSENNKHARGAGRLLWQRRRFLRPSSDGWGGPDGPGLVVAAGADAGGLRCCHCLLLFLLLLLFHRGFLLAVRVEVEVAEEKYEREGVGHADPVHPLRWGAVDVEGVGRVDDRDDELNLHSGEDVRIVVVVVVSWIADICPLS